MLGIDVSKATLACAYLDRTTERFHWERSVPNNAAGVRELLQATPADVPWVLEPTGPYGLPVVQQARAAGRIVLLAPPRQAKHYLGTLQTRAKTDRLDARGLACFAATRPKAEALRPYPVKSASVEHLDQLLAARRGITAALTSLQQRSTALPHAAAPLQAAVAGLQAQRQELDRQIAKLAGDREQFPHVTRLRQVTGIGPVIAAAVAARLTSHTFGTADQFIAYIGLDVRVRRSGRRVGQCGLTKQGDAELRRLFYLAAQANTRCKASPFKEQYQRELAKGLARPAALNAVARKLARVCWSLVKYGADYDPDQVHTPAPGKGRQWQGD